MHTYDIYQKGNSLEKAKSAIIFIHGRGGSPEDIVELSEFLVDDSWCVLAPRAINRTWYPYSFMASEDTNAPWLESTIKVVNRLLEETRRFIEPENTVLVGFSQGACVVSEVVSRNANKYQAVIIFTGGLIGEEVKPSKYSGDFKNTPIYITNGDQDAHVPLSRSIDTKHILEKLGANVTLEVFNGRPHTITQRELERAKSFISSPILPTPRI